MRSSTTPSVRRMVLRLTVGSFSLAALMGVAALLRPGRFGATEGRVLLTTLVIGATSVLMLCYLAATGERSRLLGVAGSAAALLAAGCALLMVWASVDRGNPSLTLVRTFGVSLVVAVTLAQFSLLVAVAHRRPAVVRLLAATVVAGTVLGALVIGTILGWSPSDAGGRGIGVVLILDVLGTVVTLALGVFGGRLADAAAPVDLPAGLVARLRETAEASGRSPSELLQEVVSRYLDGPDVENLTGDGSGHAATPTLAP